MKILAFFLTAVVSVCAGAVLFFFLLLGLNGFTESQAGPGLILYIVWVLLFSLVAAALSFFLTRWLADKKSWNAALAALLSTFLFSFAGAASSFAGIFAAIILIEALR